MKPEAQSFILGYMKQKADGTLQFGFWDMLSQKYISTFHPFEKAVKYLMNEKGVSKLRPQDDPILLTRLLLGRHEKMENALEKGITNHGGNRLIDTETDQLMNLRWLVDPMNSDDPKAIEAFIEKVVGYMTSQRTLEIIDRYKKAEIEEYEQKLADYKAKVKIDAEC